jgi:hypothetical protein
MKTKGYRNNLAARGSVVVKALYYKRKVSGSITNKVIFFLNLANPSGRTRLQGLLSL